MKKKVRVKSLPKAQTGMQAPLVLTPEQKLIWYKNQGIWGNLQQDLPYFSPTVKADAYKGDPNTTGNFDVGMPAFNLNTSPSFYADAYQGDPNTTGNFDVGMPSIQGLRPSSFAPKTSVGEPLAFTNANTTPFNNPFALSDPNFIYNTKRPATSGEFIKSPGMGPIGADDYYANLAQQNIAAPAGTRFDKDFGYAPGTAMPSDLIKKPKQKKGNPYIGPMLLAGTNMFSSIARKLQDRNVKQDFRNQFLSDNSYNARPEDYSGNRGDYVVDTPGFGLNFRPDEAIIEGYNKIAQMGGEMKRKVKITSLPQAGYGGTQDAKAVNQLYGNSAYMMNMFNGATKGEPQEQYGQTLGPDPRSISVLEAEKGETLVRKGTNSTIPEFFKIGGKRHSEGGTPLAGDKATPDSFIYSDTKAMKIKDPAILESFGFAAKKGGYTPAQISKKFDLNNKDLREGLYSENDPLRKKTSVMMADNYISNLGKLALVQESQKGFPQGVPQIAVPYMDKVGLDPAQFLPPSLEEGMTMAMYGGIPKAQVGRQQIGTYYNTEMGKVLPIYNFEENRSGLDNGPRLLFPTQGELIKSGVDYMTEAQKKKIALLNYEKAKAASQVVPQTIQPVTTPEPVPVTQKVKPAAQPLKPKVDVAKPSTGYTAPDGSIIEFEYGGESLYQAGGEKGTFLAKHTDASGKEYSSYLKDDKVVLVDSNNEVVSTRPATEKDKPAIETYDTEEEKLLKSIAPNVILPKDYVEGNQPGKVAKIPGTFGRFDKGSADKNWSWYNKPIDWTNQLEVGTAQKAYNREMTNRFIKAGYTPEEAARYVKTIGFDESKESGIPNAYDKKAGKYTETRVVFDVPPKPKKPGTEENRERLKTNELEVSRTPRRPIGFYPQDVLNTAAAVGDLASINRYFPRMAQFTAEPMKPTFYDPNRELAANAEMANIAAGNLAQFTGPQAFNTRFSDVQGKSLANAANILGRYNNLNVGVANQFEQANKQLINEANFRNQLATNDFYDKTITTNQQYDNARRAGRRQVVDYANAALENRFMTDQMNSLYPNYFVDPAYLKTYYTPGRQITPAQRGNDMMAYLESTGIPFDFTDPSVQAALLKGIMGDVNVDERGNIAAAQAGMSKRRSRTT